MELIIGIWNIIVGIGMTLIGYKVFNLFYGSNEPEKKELWYKKFGTFFKIGGILIAIIGIYLTIKHL